jgi:hypothetical protein
LTCFSLTEKETILARLDFTVQQEREKQKFKNKNRNKSFETPEKTQVAL